MINQPKASGEGHEPEKEESSPPGITPRADLADTPATPGEAQTTNSAKEAQRRQYIVRFGVAIWRCARRCLEFCDKHDGAITALATVAIVVLTVFYVTYSKRQWETMQQQTTLLRQSLVGSQAAIVTLTLSLYPNSMLSVNFDPRGVAAAKNVCFAFHAVRKSIPDLDTIGLPISHTACEPILSDKVVQGPQEFALPGLTPAVMEEIRRTEQTVMVTGQFSYDNGFGDIERQNVCLYWLSGIPNKTEAEGGGNGFVPCEGFSVRLNNVLKARMEGEANKR